MGKGCSKDAQHTVQDDGKQDTMENLKTSDYKSRLENKLCLSKENPAPIFDISQCNIDKLPVSFAFIKVLRKEILILSRNQLKSLASGGEIKELELIKVIDLSYNKFKIIPTELCYLKNLKELFLSHNNLTRLPNVLNRLQQLELLDISHNDLVDIRSISFMPNLRILNISGNPKLEILPPELATNDNLSDLVFDHENIKSPAMEIVSKGTINILKYFRNCDDYSELMTAPNDFEAEDNAINQQSKITTSRIIDDSMTAATKKFLNKEKVQAPDFMNNEMNEQLMKEHQKKKEEMLKSLLEQQKFTEDAVNKIHLEKDAERQKLIDDIKEYEVSSSVVVNELLSLKKGPDPALLELEDKARDALLEKVHLEQSELRKKDIISAMSQLLKEELDLIDNYNSERSKSSKILLENETKNNLLLNEVFDEYDKNRSQLVEKINQDEEWQKSAVATCILRTDARTWGLMEQIKIVEVQIAAMTNYEIDKKKMNQEELLNDVAEQRSNLTMILLDLMDQQEKRKNQLLQTLSDMENQKTENDFWLLQYQKLIDRNGVMQNAQASIDPNLGYNFLLNGVIHVVPFLLKIWNNKNFALEKVTNEDLQNAGIKNPKDREGVLKAIQDFLANNKNNNAKSIDDDDDIPCCSKTTSNDVNPQMPTAPTQEPKSPTSSASSSHDATTNAAECVICMDAVTRVIFLPCGHLCCCISCSSDLTSCPMCRGTIERKIKVIQP
ncbi:E3 ubiquitin-protein ligase LRSAM1-like [Chironomus tepperi]|uniref:E3 ubiquitin-protein ligase LRSAM1-like n=1 Tax=Chironomus tepperi TaxID=113505 RepID=UPI00391FB9CB